MPSIGFDVLLLLRRAEFYQVMIAFSLGVEILLYRIFY